MKSSHALFAGRCFLGLLLVLSGCGTAERLPARASSGPFEVAWEDRSLFRQGMVAAEQGVVDELLGATVYHLDVTISNDLRRLDGHQEVRYTNRETEPLSAIYFRTFPNTAGGSCTVSHLSADGIPAEPQSGFEGSALRVSLAEPLLPGAALVLEMDFSVKVAENMAGNYGLFGYSDGVLSLDSFMPVIPVYDEDGWNVEVPPPNADMVNYDVGFFLVRVSAPAGLTVIASGSEIGRDYRQKQQVLTFAAGPVRDFYLVAGEDFVEHAGVVGETTIRSYALSKWEAGAALALNFATKSLSSFGKRFGVYPHVEFDLVSTPMQALGMEYPGVVAITTKEYDPQVDFGGIPSQVYLESTVAHEAAHQWFYNVVGNDQIREPWLDEALAQYLTNLYYLDTYGEEAAAQYRQSWEERWQRVDRAERPIGLPAGDYSALEYGAIVYGRGPLFVAALEERMGQGRFDTFLRDYYQTYQWDMSSGRSFRQLAESHCQCDLTSLFDAWVYP